MKVLLGRQVIVLPDLGACNRWRKKAKDYPLLDITVSDYLEKNATPQQREMGADLADWVVEERMAEGGFLLHNFLQTSFIPKLFTGWDALGHPGTIL